ncbi:PAAR domain-containing protein [Burkholderia cenocepacia]|uniref:PAAR domain-containing protein n=1 Tax=Burkholderia cenocepacia TaxID=95486 RepID=UPI000D69B4A4|nr:PAAR domain-containing protein [Burkholderia cenocepacia]
MKPIIRKGDTTNHGGTVLDGFGLSNLNGRPASGVGHMVLCPKCQGTYPIVQGSSQYTIEGRAVARGCQDFRVQGWLSNYTEGRMNRSA